MADHASHAPKPAALATRLPLELQHQIFSCLDSHAFCAVRHVCRTWRQATLSALVLRGVLAELPVLQPDAATAHDCFALEKRFDEAAIKLMLNTRITPSNDTNGIQRSRLTAAVLQNLHPTMKRPRETTNMRGDRKVVLQGTAITLLDCARRSADSPLILARRQLDSRRRTAFGEVKLTHDESSCTALALSSTGNLLAVAMGKTIRLYDLLAGDASPPVHHHVDADFMICGLDFEQDDHLLRVRFSREADVLYLGHPCWMCVSHREGTALSHWQHPQFGLSHVLLHTSKILLRTARGYGATMLEETVSGVQILCPFHDGYLLVGRCSPHDHNGQYFLGFLTRSQPLSDDDASNAQRRLFKLAELHSIRSGAPYYRPSATLADLWRDMPLANEHYPLYALSRDGRLLVLAENRAELPGPKSWVFVYRLPGAKSLEATIAEPLSANVSGGKPDPQDAESDPQPPTGINAIVDANWPVAVRMPLSLGVVQGEADHVGIAATDSSSYLVTVATASAAASWNLEVW